MPSVRILRPALHGITPSVRRTYTTYSVPRYGVPKLVSDLDLIAVQRREDAVSHQPQKNIVLLTIRNYLGR